MSAPPPQLCEAEDHHSCYSRRDNPQNKKFAIIGFVEGAHEEIKANAKSGRPSEGHANFLRCKADDEGPGPGKRVEKQGTDSNNRD